MHAQHECDPTLPHPNFKDSPFSMTGDVLSLLASCFRHFCHTIEAGRHPCMPLFAQSSPVLTLTLGWKCPNSRGGSRNFFYWGGPNFGSERTELFCAKLLLPHTPTPPPTSRGCMHVIIPLPLTVYLNSTRKDAPLEHPPLVLQVTKIV